MTDAIEVTDPGQAAAIGVLLATCVSTLVVNANTSAVTILLPAIAEDVDASVSTLQWAVTGYSLVGAACIVTSGALGDVFGRRTRVPRRFAAVHRLLRADRAVRLPGRGDRRAVHPGCRRVDDPRFWSQPAHRGLVGRGADEGGLAVGSGVGGRCRRRAPGGWAARRLGRVGSVVLDRRRDRCAVHPVDD